MCYYSSVTFVTLAISMRYNSGSKKFATTTSSMTCKYLNISDL